MRTRFIAPAILLPLAGCVGDGSGRQEGVTLGAGNAIAANTVMQMVDPWQKGVEDTDLAVPADRATVRRPAPDGAAAAATTTDN
jgi:hypothetical protein